MNKAQGKYGFSFSFLSFLKRLGRGFIKNQILLLSGAVAYYTLLSIIPLSIIALIVLTQCIEEQTLIITLSTYLEMVIPGYAATLTEQALSFLENRKVVGVIGFSGMLFFSSTAFSMLEKAMAVIFSQRVSLKRRSFLASAIIPYVYIFIIGVGIVLVSFVVGLLETLEKRVYLVQGLSLDLGGSTGVSLYLLGIIGEVLMLTSVYLVMPVVQIRFRHALIGGIFAAVLWEITRRVLVWYYATISTLNVIYGSITITVVALLSIEVAALIVLLGAQIIAVLEVEPDSESVNGHGSGI